MAAGEKRHARALVALAAFKTVVALVEKELEAYSPQRRRSRRRAIVIATHISVEVYGLPASAFAPLSGVSRQAAALRHRQVWAERDACGDLDQSCWKLTDQLRGEALAHA